MRLKGVVYDVGRAMGALSVNWRPDYTPALLRRELDIIASDLHANAVRLGGRNPHRLLDAAEYAASIGLQVWMGPELWNATPERTLAFVSDAAAAADPLFRRYPNQLTFCVGNEFTFLMRGIVPGRNHAQRAQAPNIRELIRSDQSALRRFLTDLAVSVRRVYSGPITYCALPIERVDWEHFDIVAVNYYRQSRQGLTDEQYLAKLQQLQAADKPVVVSEFGFTSSRDADNPEHLSGFNARPAALLPGIGKVIRPRVRTAYPRDEHTQARLLLGQLQLLEHANVDGAFLMCFSFPLAPYSDDPRHDIDATSLSIVRSLPDGQRGTTYPDMAWEPKQAFHTVASYYASR
ncbi:MAG TPA: hypothetical protein VMA77_26995 [Solirubrobacteraceae bacterium]|nr:hypothetical protein [Solirubrobacteraceae bacterium]